MLNFFSDAHLICHLIIIICVLSIGVIIVFLIYNKLSGTR